MSVNQMVNWIDREEIAEVKFDADDGKISLSLGMDSWANEDGSYPNAKYYFFCYTDGQADTLEIPFRLRKGE